MHKRVRLMNHNNCAWEFRTLGLMYRERIGQLQILHIWRTRFDIYRHTVEFDDH